MRGGTVPTGKRAEISSGLSPHARGNLDFEAVLSDRSGSIPACAGEPNTRPQPAAPARVYPRMRGGTLSPFAPATVPGGLSPHARGNRSHKRDSCGAVGSIPACAGEPIEYAGHLVEVGVYPRMRGGTDVTRTRYPPAAGLSPHARGNPLTAHHPQGWWGSIPACAGEPLDHKHLI